MAAFYQKFLRKHLDLSPLSVMRREDNDPYFCTPKGASIFGWAGVDGIHFCFVRGFGETVFAVSPMNGGKDCVHVIARDFSDFCACCSRPATVRRSSRRGSGTRRNLTPSLPRIRRRTSRRRCSRRSPQSFPSRRWSGRGNTCASCKRNSISASSNSPRTFMIPK